MPLVALLVGICALAMTGEQKSSDAASHRERGSVLLGKGDAAEALAAFRAAVALDPTDAVSHDAIGIILGDGGNLSGAVDAFREAIRVQPAFARAHFHLGLALERLERAHEAVAVYARALRLEPGLVEARFGLSSATAALGDLDGAISLLRQVVTAIPTLAEPHYNLGVHLGNRYKGAPGPSSASDLDAAVAHLRSATQLVPDEARYHAALGRLLADRQDLDAAVTALRRARRLKPDRPDHAYDLGLALRIVGDLEGAEAELRAAVAGNPSDGLARRALALVLRTKGDLAGAAAEFRAAVAALPDDAQAHHLLGSVLLKLDDPSAGLASLRRAIELDPSLTEARATLAQALARAGRRDQAREQQDAVLRITAERAATGRAMVLVDSARDHIEGGNSGAALLLLREAVALAPSLAEAHFQLARTLSHLDEENPRSQVDAASAVDAALMRAIEIDPRYARAYLELGLRAAARNEVAGALEALRHAVSLAPGLVDAQRALSELATRQRDWPTVIAALEAVMAWQPDDTSTAMTLTRALLRQGDCVGASSLFQQIVRRDRSAAPGSPELSAELQRCAG